MVPGRVVPGSLDPALQASRARVEGVGLRASEQSVWVNSSCLRAWG